MTMTMKKTMTVLVATSALALGACASSPEPNPRLTSLQTSLNQARADQYTADKGRAALENADNQLDMAAEAWDDGDRDETTHHLNMAEGYIELAEVRGDQARVDNQIASLKEERTKVRLAAREREAEIAKMEADAYRTQAEIAADEAERAKAQLAALETELAEYELKMNELGATLVLQDVMFETDSAELRAGAAKRLDTLISYLRANPEVAIVVEGHTDNVGDETYNERLSEKRAESVADVLIANAIAEARIETRGYGESKPIASNDTVSGREENRRVEITLVQE